MRTLYVNIYTSRKYLDFDMKIFRKIIDLQDCVMLMRIPAVVRGVSLLTLERQSGELYRGWWRGNQSA